MHARNTRSRFIPVLAGLIIASAIVFVIAATASAASSYLYVSEAKYATAKIVRSKIATHRSDSYRVDPCTRLTRSKVSCRVTVFQRAGAETTRMVYRSTSTKTPSGRGYRTNTRIIPVLGPVEA